MEPTRTNRVQFVERMYDMEVQTLMELLKDIFAANGQAPSDEYGQFGPDSEAEEETF